MYSWEIEEYLKNRNYNITPLEFMAIINTSPQIKDVYYEPEDNYRIKTDDGYTRDIKMETKVLKLKKDS